jgi:hypothetical protein
VEVWVLTLQFALDSLEGTPIYADGFYDPLVLAGRLDLKEKFSVQ